MYHAQMTACPMTCRDPESASTCTLPTVAGCGCPEDLYLDEGVCKRGSQCQCFDENNVPHEVSWNNNLRLTLYIRCISFHGVKSRLSENDDMRTVLYIMLANCYNADTSGFCLQFNLLETGDFDDNIHTVVHSLSNWGTFFSRFPYGQCCVVQIFSHTLVCYPLRKD